MWLSATAGNGLRERRTSHVAVDDETTNRIVLTTIRWTGLGKDGVPVGLQGDVVEMELRASRLGSKLDGIVELTHTDKTLVTTLERDGKTLVTLPKDGDYVLRVRDRYRSRGGPGFGYRLRIDRPRLGFLLTARSDSLTANS